MKKAEIKQQILESQKSGDGGGFTESTLAYLPLIDSKSELDEFVNYFSNRAVFELLESKATDSIKKMIADKIFEVVLDKNDIMSVTYTYLYLFYKEHGSIEDDRLDKYLNYLLSIDSSSLGDIEKCYVYNMRFVLQMLRGDEGVVEQFLSDCAILHMHKTEPVDQANSVLEFLQRCEVPVEVIFGVLKKRLDVDEYLKLGFYQRRSIFNWSLHVFWNVPRYYGSRLWADMYESLKAIFYAHLDRGEIDEAMYVHFFIYHKMGNIFQTQEEWAKFNEEISKKAVPYYQEFAKQKSFRAPKKEMSKEGKKKIGILKDRLVENSPFKVEYSLLKALMEDEEFKEKYEIKVYNMSYFEKSSNDPKCEKKLKSIGIDVLDAMLPFYKDGFYHSHLSKAIFLREMIINDEVDILISTVGAYDICDFILSTRTAPKQIYWSHGNFEYDVDGIDKRISHISNNSGMNKSSYTVNFFPISVLDEYLGLEDEKYREKADEIRSRFSEDQIILGSIGRYIKVDSHDYLEAVAEIMREYPNTVYLACGSGNEESIRSKVEELGILDRFYFEGWVDTNVYSYVIDVYLDTFPLTGGQSVMEYGRKNKGMSIVANENANSSDKYIDIAKQDIELYNEIPKSTYLKMLKNRMELDTEFAIKTLSSMNLDIIPARLKLLYEIAKYLRSESGINKKDTAQEKIVLFRICEPEDYTEQEVEALNVMLSSPNILFYSFSPKGEVHSIIDAENFISLKIDAFSDTLKEYSFSMYIQGKNETYYRDMAPLRLAKNILFFPIYYEDHVGYESYKGFMLEKFEQSCVANKESFLKGMDEFVGCFGKVYSGELPSFFEINDCGEVAEKVYSSNTGTMGKKIVSLGYDSAVADAFIDSYSSMPPMSTLAKNISLLSHDIEGFREYYSCIKNYQQAQVAKTLEKLQSREEKDSVGLFITSIDS